MYTKTFNDYKVFENGDCEFYVQNRKGVVYVVKVDEADLRRLIELNKSWNVHKTSRNNYAIWTERFTDSDGVRKNRSIYLHRWIMGVTDRNILVDHINFDTLDNRRSNLRLVSVSENSRHRKGANANSKSGYRNVALIDGKWTVQLYVDGRNRQFGKFDDVDEAKRYADELRNQYYGTFI